MRQCALIFVLLLFAIESPSQGQVLRQASGGRGFLGVVGAKYTAFRGQGAMMIGGGGGWYIAPGLSLGGSAYGTVTAIDAKKDVLPDAPFQLDIKFESFGFDLHYIPRPAAPFHPVYSILVGGGAGHYVRDNTTEQHGETDFMLLLEPSIGMERRLTNSLQLNLSLSYRIVSGVEQQGLDNGDFNGPAIGVMVKIGQF